MGGLDSGEVSKMGWEVLSRRRWKRVRKKHPMTTSARLVEIDTTPYPVSFIFIWLDC